jgi:hypothetical protein
MRSTRAIRTRKVRGTIYKANFATDESAQRLDLRGVRFIYRSLWRPLLRGGVVGLHPSERLFHFAEDPNRVGIRRTIAFEPRDQGPRFVSALLAAALVA